MAKTPVREYAVLYLDRTKRSSTVAGGNAILNAGQHAIDGPEHTGLLDIDDLSDVDTTTNAPAMLDVLTWDGTNWVPYAIPGIGGSGSGGSFGGGSVDVQDDEVSVVNPASAISFGDGLSVTDLGGGVARVDADAAASEVIWRPLMATAPHLVTTDGIDQWVVLTLSDGTAIMVYS